MEDGKIRNYSLPFSLLVGVRVKYVLTCYWDMR